MEVSWSPPNDGANIITGYRIFYNDGRSVLLPSIAMRLDLNLDGNQMEQQISIRSEREQEFSELISVAIIMSSKPPQNKLPCHNNNIHS